MKKRKGFSVIELIVVIAVITVLLLVLVPVMSGFVGTSQSTVCKANEKNIAEDAEAAYGLARISDSSANAITAAKEQLASDFGSYQVTGGGSLLWISGACPNGGTYTLVYADDRYQIICSKHGSDGETDAAYLVRLAYEVANGTEKTSANKTLAKTLEDYFRNYYNKNTRDHLSIDSTSPGTRSDGTQTYTSMIKAVLTGAGFSDIDAKSWRVQRGASKGYKIYFSSTDIAKLSPGTVVSRVAVYDSITSEVSYQDVTVGWSNASKKDYIVFNGSY